MRRSHLILTVLLIVPMVLVLSSIWEFVIEPWAHTAFGLHDSQESDEARLDFVLTSTVFSALALIGPLVVLLRLHARWQRTQDALIAATAEAERANETKSLFLANVSHELRTPLNAIIGFSDTIKREVFGPIGHPRYADYIGDIHQSGEHLLAMVNDLLDLAAAEAGKLAIAVEPVDLGAVAREAGRIIQPRADAASLRFTVDAGPPGVIVEGDFRRVLQVALNLLANAVNYTPSGGSVGIAVGVGEERTEAGMERHGIVTVSDTGPGMDAAAMARAVQPFERAVHGTPSAHAGQGTGLGLPLARRLAEIMGGRLLIDSAPGAGTRVAVLFPLPAHSSQQP